MTLPGTNASALDALTARAKARGGRLIATDLTPEELDLAAHYGIPVDAPAPTRLEAATAVVDALETAILAGEPVTGADLAAARAAAQAEAEVVELATRGAREREKAAKDLARRRENAKAAVRKNLPVVPAGELDALTGIVRDGLAAILAARTAHAATIEATKQTLADGGVIERDINGTNSPDELAAMDWDTHGMRNIPAAVIDGVAYTTDAYTKAITDLARQALRMVNLEHKLNR